MGISRGSMKGRINHRIRDSLEAEGINRDVNVELVICTVDERETSKCSRR